MRQGLGKEKGKRSTNRNGEISPIRKETENSK
jgi:hypothetical protein